MSENTRGLGYRPALPRVVRTPTEQKLVDNIDQLNAAVAQQQINNQERAKGLLTFEQLVSLSKRDTIAAADLDLALTSIYEYGQQLEDKATIASEFVAQTIEPVDLDKAFKEDTKADALLLFGKEIDQLTPEMIRCLNKITLDSDLTESQINGDANTPNSPGTAKDKFADMASIDKVLGTIRLSAPKFGFELLLLLILVVLQEILKLILSPLCPIEILGIKVGRMIAEAIADGVYLGTVHMIDVRDVCMCKEDPGPECDQKYNQGLHASVANQWNDIGPNYFRGETPGFPTPTPVLPICDDLDPNRKPNLYETHAALSILNSFKQLAARVSATDTRGSVANKYENTLAYINTDAAKHAATSIKLTAGNMQDTVRVAPGAIGVSTSLSAQGTSPGAQFAKSEFGAGVTKSLNQVLQQIKAVDNWIRATVSMVNFDSKMADMICCFIRLIFNYAVYLSQTDTTNNSIETTIKGLFNTPPDKPFSDLTTIFNEATQKTIQSNFNKMMTGSKDAMSRTAAALSNDPKFNEAIKDVIKSMKLIEAIISAISSTISADLNFGISLDLKKLRDAMIGVIGKTMTLAIDVLMTEIRQPTEDFIVAISSDPRWSAALKTCELFTLMTGMLACGIDALEITMKKMIEGFQRDTDGNWLQINASISAAYNQKFAKFILDIINLIMNDIYMLFTICNVDTIYAPEQLTQASLNVANSLGIDKQIQLQFEQRGYIDQIYADIGGGMNNIQVGVLGTEAADKVFTGAALGFTFADPLNNTLSPLMKLDFDAMTTPTTDTINGRTYNTSVPVTPAAAIGLKLAEKDCLNCSTTDFISRPIVTRLDRSVYRGFA